MRGNGKAPQPTPDESNQGHTSLPPDIDWESLQERGAPPAREWVIEHWLGVGHVTLLAGRGGLGKSLLAQQIASNVCLGRNFVERVPEARSVVLWAGEDDPDELWRRQLAIAATMKVPLDAFRGRLAIASFHDIDATLAISIHGNVAFTPLLQGLADKIKATGATLVILDNIARLFGGDENSRHQVSTFIAALNGAARMTSASILLLGHTAKPKESEFSGSTAWENAVRARLYFSDHPPDQAPQLHDAEPAAELRYLARRKANYSAKDIAMLRYEQGAYVLVAPESGIVGNIIRERARSSILAAVPRLIDMRMHPCESHSSPRYLPRLMIDLHMNDGCTRQDLQSAMLALMADRVLLKKEVGRYGSRNPIIGFVVA